MASSESRGWRSWLARRSKVVESESSAPPAPREQSRAPLPAPSASEEATTQLLDSVAPAFGWLVVDDGPASLLHIRIPIGDAEMTLGRSAGCDVTIPDAAVSRTHASLRRDGDGLMLVHHSSTNGTCLNGVQVVDPEPLYDGDQIQLANRVRLRVQSALLPARLEPKQQPATLRQVMEERVQLEERIEQEFVREGSFVDLDVVDSFGLKQGQPTERVVVSFERFRSFVEQMISAHGGRVLNSNGDEVMVFFADADAALHASRQIQRELPAFNDAANRLARPFRTRIGIHSGRCAVDLERGVAYSSVLDGAGHLQKAAPPGGVLISDATYRALSKPPAELEAAGRVTKTAELDTWVLAPETIAHNAAAREPGSPG